MRLPHVNWTSLQWSDQLESHDGLRQGLHENDTFYFIHSFAPLISTSLFPSLSSISNNQILAQAHYEGVDFGAVVGKGRVVGTQFHPEKSGSAGLQFLRNFLTYSQAFSHV